MLALIAAASAGRDRGRVIVVDRRRRFNPLAAIALGIPPASLVMVYPETNPDEQWAIDQALRCPAIAAVVAWPERLDGRTFRRWQLACETSGAIGCLVRQASERGEPTWADVRLLVRPCAMQEQWRIDVEMIHCRGGRQGSAVKLTFDERSGASHETHTLFVAPELADPAAHQNTG